MNEVNEVKALREKLGLSQDAFAARLGVAPFTVRRWEKGGKPSPMARQLLKEIEKEMRKYAKSSTG